jgi:hypothetical protein
MTNTTTCDLRNGGPGSSSILGMLQENGPLLINATGGLMRNPYSWTKQANMLILERLWDFIQHIQHIQCSDMFRYQISKSSKS